MGTDHRDDNDRRRRVQELCAQVSGLVSLSLEQRRAIDRLLRELETVARRARLQLGQAVRSAGTGTACPPRFSTEPGSDQSLSGAGSRSSSWREDRASTAG